VNTWTSSARVMKQNGAFTCRYINQYSVYHIDNINQYD
jgi:hypothetical protein